jgi:hypothetical protein
MPFFTQSVIQQIINKKLVTNSLYGKTYVPNFVVNLLLLIYRNNLAAMEADFLIPSGHIWRLVEQASS